MLAGFFVGMWPQEAVAAIRSRESDRIEFVISHDRAGTASVDHSADDVDDRYLPGAAVDQVTEKQGRSPLRAAVGAADFPVAQLTEQRHKFAVQIGRAACRERVCQTV